MLVDLVLRYVPSVEVVANVTSAQINNSLMASTARGSATCDKRRDALRLITCFASPTASSFSGLEWDASIP